MRTRALPLITTPVATAAPAAMVAAASAALAAADLAVAVASAAVPVEAAEAVAAVWEVEDDLLIVYCLQFIDDYIEG